VGRKEERFIGGRIDDVKKGGREGCSCLNLLDWSWVGSVPWLLLMMVRSLEEEGVKRGERRRLRLVRRRGEWTNIIEMWAVVEGVRWWRRVRL
jgi:hypothetical protein